MDSKPGRAEPSVRKPFRFKQFSVADDHCGMKVGTDGILLGAWAPVASCRSVADFGTGSGLIALMIAQRTADDVCIDAIEIDPVASEQADRNFDASPWPHRLRTHTDSIQEFAGNHRRTFDLIVCNPPYFSGALPSPSRSRNRARHDERLTRAELMEAASIALTDGGRFVVIAPHVDVDAYVRAGRQQGLFLNRLVSVRPLPDLPFKRALMDFSSQTTVCEESQLVIENSHHVYTEAYLELTRDFYLNR